MSKTIVLKVSYPNIDVKTANPKDCTLHSDYPNMKCKVNQATPHFGVVDYTFTSNPASVSTTTIFQFAHGYNYVPFNICYGYSVVAPAGWLVDTYAPLPFAPTFGDYNPQMFFAYADSTNFYITFYVNDALGFGIDDMSLTSWTFKYYVFAENGSA